ncbi:MAG: glycoside hydrolase family 76 protein [Candidatus Symbiothrix sp.]|nr:glycoside hydrolase family 76 protein [Candidatus Symbiothrix sp.]
MSEPCLANDKHLNNNRFTAYAVETLDSIYTHYSVADTLLLRENFPFDNEYIASYLASHEQKRPNPYSFLWPYSGSLTAVAVLYETTADKHFLQLLDDKVLPALEEYFDQSRSPDAYASYIRSAPLSDRFYDDNVWIGIDFTDLYLASKDPRFLEKAKLIWRFIESGIDSLLGGGIYWCEQKKTSKNTCSNAPGSVYALKLYLATNENSYLEQGKALYEWTKAYLQDTTDYLYYDNIRRSGRMDKTKYAYNSGQMMQAAALLYKITKDNQYLIDAQNIAESCCNYFFNGLQTDGADSFRLLKGGNVWFTAVMLRGFFELYSIDGNKTCMNAFRQNLDYAWKSMRDDDGLFGSDWSGRRKDNYKWLLTQWAMVEMYARMAAF